SRSADDPADGAGRARVGARRLTSAPAAHRAPPSRACEPDIGHRGDRPRRERSRMASIDLNSDLGESTPDRVVGDDRAMLEIVTSANVSSGFHAGSPEGIRDTLAAAVRGGVVIGAHPGYRDYENFGRTDVDIDSATLQAHIEYQLGALEGLARAVGGRVAYVKPHGALYNSIARDERRAADVVAAIRAIDPGLVLLGLAGGVVLEVARRAGLQVAAEAFADR